MDEDLVFKNLKRGKEVEPGWFRLRWKLIKNGTYNIYITNHDHHFGISFWLDSAHNGWGRSYKGFSIEIGLWWTLNIWVKWDFVFKIPREK